MSGDARVSFEKIDIYETPISRPAGGSSALDLALQAQPTQSGIKLATSRVSSMISPRGGRFVSPRPCEKCHKVAYVKPESIGISANLQMHLCQECMVAYKRRSVPQNS